MHACHTNGPQIVVEFSGSPSSQEINGNYDAVSCDEVFSSVSASSLGVGSTCQFLSDSSLKVIIASDTNDSMCITYSVWCPVMRSSNSNRRPSTDASRQTAVHATL